MHTFLVLLHVVAAVFLIGPLVIAPMFGLRALRTGNPDGLRDAARQTTLYGLLSLVVFGFGVLAVATEDDDYTFGTIWVNVSLTLYILALLLTLLVVAPALNKAAKLITAPSTVQVDPVDGELPAPEPGLTAPVPLSAQQPEVKGKLDGLRGRIAASSGIASVLILVITALMVLKPFGD
jgi:uncharacterized membrane protein